MEYIEGKTIRDMVESGIVSVRKAIDIILQAAEALEAAHKKGILHRDVKSANIMVTMEGRVKVMDFGLAHVESRSQLTRTGTTMGTLSYSSPEQISGRPVDRRSEIFSLGVVFYELLTGQLPFKATNEAEIVFAIINNEPPKLSRVRDDVPELVEAVISRMLEKDPELRYPTCGDVINDLKGLRKEMETSTVGITGTLTQLSKARKSRRFMWAVTGAAATVLIIAAGLIVLPGGPKLDKGKAVVGVFENINQDPELDKFASLPVLWITQGLQASEIIEAEQIQYALQLNDELQRETERSGRLENALSLLARGAGAGWVITGQYWQQGGDLFFQAEIIDATRGRNGIRLEGTEPIRGSPEAPDSLMSTLRDQIIALLARHIATDFEIGRLGAPTVSLEAFNDYKAAGEAFTRGQRMEALRLCYQALERDPDYLTALIMAVTVTHNERRFTECDSLVQVAEQKRDAMTRWERLFLDDLKGWLYGDREASYRASREWVGESSLSYYEAGLNAGNVNRPHEAIRYLSRIDFDLPWSQQWIANWTVYAGELNRIGRHRKALKVIRHGRSVRAESRSLLNAEARTLAAMGKIRELERVVEESINLLPTSSWSPPDLMTGSAEILIAYGHSEEGRALAERAVAWYEDHPDEKEGYPGSYAFTLVVAGRDDEARSLYDTLLSENPNSITSQGRYGILLASAGEREAAQEVSERLAQIEDTRFLKGAHTFWRACIAAHLGDLDDAVQLLNQAYREGNAFGWYLKYSIEVAPLQDHSSFQAWFEPRG